MATNSVNIGTPGTVCGRILLGWWQRDDAIAYLMNDCHFDPPITAINAERMWREYRDRTEALQQRDALAPQRLTLNHEERAHANAFLAFLRTLGYNDIEDIIKIDLSKLVAYQYYVVTERAETYQQKITTSNGWLNEAMPCHLPPETPFNANFMQNGFNTAIDYDIPHAEFAFLPDHNGLFAARQLLRHVTVVANGDRLWLWAGYHRSFARILATTPSAAVPSAVVALTRNTLVAANKSAGAVVGVPDDIGPLGRRPALLGDFFDPNLFMAVNLRKKRYQLQVRATWTALNI